MSHGVSDAVWDEYYAPISKRDSWSVLPTNLRPTSRGSIRLQSSDPYDDPIIDPNYYADPQVIDMLLKYGALVSHHCMQTVVSECKRSSHFLHLVKDRGHLRETDLLNRILCSYADYRCVSP